MRFKLQLLVILWASWAATAECGFSAAFTVPLSLSVETGPYGDYLSSSFDFGTSFAQIDSITLDFAMPSGYEGSFASTGNSSFSRSLALVLHDPSVLITSPWSISPENGITQLMGHVGTVESVSVRLFREGSFSIPGRSVGRVLPNFLVQGYGQIAFIDTYESRFHPLPDRITVSSSTSWMPPLGIVNASLTVIGVPAPEPNSILMVLIGGALCGGCVTRRRCRSGYA